MLKHLFTIILICAAQTAASQVKPVDWNVSAKKINDTVYTLILSGSIQPGWYVYAESNQMQGLDSIELRWENESIKRKGDMETKTTPEIINDGVFESKEKVFKNAILFTQNIVVKKSASAIFKVNIQSYAANGKEFLPINDIVEVEFEGSVALNASNNIKLSSIDIARPTAGCGEKQQNNKGLLAIFFLGFGGGLLALLTPCVFPMIPVTVSFFTNKAKTRREGITNGLLYGSFIFLIYLLASIPFHLLNNVNPEVLNNISTNAWLNVFFFVVFIVFALSFFGLFEIGLPSSVTNSAGSKGGIFFMALTLVTVSFSCTGIILGSLLVGSLSSNSGALQLTAGMGGFGAALALPFALFAMFPQWMKALPKSGGWLDSVKKVLAFVELALAFKFLSNADLVEHWGLLKREVFIGIWLIISLGLVLYLFGLTPNPSPLREGRKNIAWPRKAFGVMVLLFALYLVPGLTQSSYANLKLLSGFAPPMSYSIYGKDNVNGKGLEPNVINDYEKALQLSREQNKPLLIDFTGWACVNCRKMEEQVWTKTVISDLIKDKFILVSLYVDDRKRLPEEQRFTYKDAMGNKREIKTLGDKWATLEAENFKQVTQPLYVILSPDERLMNNPVGYTPNENKYKEWLECGLGAYGK